MRATGELVECSRNPAGFAHHALNIFNGLAGRGFPFTIDLIYVRLATRHRGARHRLVSHVTKCAMLSQGAKRTRRDASLAVTWPGTRHAANLQRIFQQFSSDWQTEPGECVVQGYVYAISKSVILFKGIGYGSGVGASSQKEAPVIRVCTVASTIFGKKGSGDRRKSTWTITAFTRT
jgi:hypothetical protein